MEFPVPPGKEYAPFQKSGIRYALGARGTIIADEMGLGKTVQAIGVLNTMTKRTREALIVCPAGLRTNWHNELAAWRLPAAPRCTVMSYHEAQQLCTRENAGQIPPGYYGTLIFDEAQYIKNGDTQRCRAIEQIAKGVTDKVIALTGTPMENRVVELWPLLRIVCPEVWDPPRPENRFIESSEQRESHPGAGPNFWDFARRYCDLKMKSFKYGRGFRKTLDFSGASNLEELNRKLRQTCMVRRMKADVLPELPAKRRQIILLKSKVNDDTFIPHVNDENYYDVLDTLKADKVLFEEYSRKRHEQGLAKINSFFIGYLPTFSDYFFVQFIICRVGYIFLLDCRIYTYY